MRTDASFGAAPKWMTLLGTSEKGGRDYVPRVEGEIPPGLRGSLYRNGPGLFERGDFHLRHLLDGDGLVQRLSFSNQGVRYQNAFVRTDKFRDENATGKRLHATWSTRKPGGFLRNLGGGVDQSQAGITVYPVNGKILARDETGPTYEIDAETLATKGILPVADQSKGIAYKAHSRVDPETGDWLLAGVSYGRISNVYATTFDSDFKPKSEVAVDARRMIYIHDFIVSKKHFIFVLHPCMFSPLPFLMGLKSYIDCFSWNPKKGNLIAVLPRAGGEAKYYEAPSAYMWHALNAFERDDELIADFVGYDEPDHFFGRDAFMFNIMEGRMGRAQVPGKIRRYVIDLKKGSLREEILDHSNHEFPQIDFRRAGVAHQFGYFAYAGLGGFNSGIKRYDYETGKSQTHDFGEETHVGEPIFAKASGGAIDEGWILCQCVDGKSEKTFFAVFDAQTVDRGPITKIWLEHHVPISFHGSWHEVT